MYINIIDTIYIQTNDKWPSVNLNKLHIPTQPLTSIN